MNIAIELRDSNGSSRRFSFDRFPILIGRGSDAHLQLMDRWVSRRHCEIDCCDGTFLLRDLHSKHGTLVNHHLVDEAVLEPGDVVNVGLSTLVIVEPQSDGAAKTEPGRHAMCDRAGAR